MQTDTQKYNESIKPNSKEIEILKKYFPQCFSKPATDENGTAIKELFDTEKLVELLNKDEVDIKKEGFTLNFLGKSYARYQANLDSETVIVPDEQNAHIQSENVYIVGDNLDALQHLKYSYAEKIKCIYIDPPYNTGKEDFVYNDKFGFTAKDFIEKLDVTEEEAERICSMNGKCTHSAWLTFMYPRLALARELLRDDGVIFISIDDNEQANLKRLCDEVFGEGNFVGELIIETATDNNPSQISTEHEYMICYARNKDMLGNWTRKSEAAEKINNQYKKLKEKKTNNSEIQEKLRKWIKEHKDELPQVAHYDNVDEKGVFHDGDIANTKMGGYKYEILHPVTHKPCKIPEKGFRFTELTMKSMLDNNNIVFGIDETILIKPKKRIEDAKELLRSVIYEDGRAATKELDNLLVRGIFPNPKSTKIISRLLDFISPKRESTEILSPCDNSDIILDFFSGSATTAHAVMQLNAQDGGSRKFIMVQLDEHVKKGSETEKAGYKTIDEIGRARIRRAAEKIKTENPETKADLSFKTFYLKSMPQNTLDKIRTFNPNSLFTSDGDIVKTLGEDTLFQTWQIKDGFGFNCNRQKIDIAGYAAYVSEDEKIGKYLYLLTGMEEKSVKELIRKIESFELTVDKIFVYGYSFDFDALNSLSTNLKTLKNRNPLEPIIRY
ncbi:site-specific DNA-methyltransferase [Treponema socranskii]|uniref:site-specific DNA-methyltransferase n=1 Tax=Treponema socranskii TaxID=53419 RepID=UPI003D924A36